MSEFSKKDVSTILYIRRLISQYRIIGAFAIGIATGIVLTDPGLYRLNFTTWMYGMAAGVATVVGLTAYVGLPAVVTRRVRGQFEEDVGTPLDEVTER